MPAEREEYLDLETGARVLRLTAGPARNVPLYFTGPVFTRDSRAVFFWSDREQGWQLYTVALTGEIRRLTDLAEGRPYCACPNQAREEAVVLDGRRLLRLDLATLATEVLYEGPPGFGAHIPSVSADGNLAALACSEEIAPTISSPDWFPPLEEEFFRRPASFVVTVDLTSGEARVVWGEREWISHVECSPTDPRLLMFCHEGSYLVQNRLWMLDRSQVVQRRPWTPYRQGEGEHITHEFFAADGRVVFQWVQDPLGPEPRSGMAAVDPRGGEVTRWEHLEPRPVHVHADAGFTRLVGDCCPGREDGRAWVSLMDLPPGGGRLEARALCRHDTSWQGQQSHPHAAFSPDGRWVAFCSDREGTPQVYAVSVGEQ